LEEPVAKLHDSKKSMILTPFAKGGKRAILCGEEFCNWLEGRNQRIENRKSSLKIFEDFFLISIPFQSR
jgi:hypothetical protein